jgi:hypothetical protein
MKSKLRHSIVSVLIASVFSVGLPVPAQAGIVGTQAATDRERIAAVIDREEVRTRLADYGVDPAEANARVAALTDEEATRLAAEMDSLAAGGGAESIILLPIYLVAMLVVGVVYLIGKAIKAGTSN